MHEGHVHNDHDHGHTHTSHGPETRDEAEALLRFTLKHNRSHEEELHELAHMLEDLGLSEAALEVHYSLDDARCATEHIERAIAAINI